MSMTKNPKNARGGLKTARSWPMNGPLPAGQAPAWGRLASLSDFKRYSARLNPHGLARAVATIPLIAALFFFVGAWRKACGTHARLTEHEVEGAKTGMFHVVTALLILTALGTAVVLWTV